MAINNHNATGATVWVNGANAAASDDTYATLTSETIGVFSLDDGEVTLTDADTINSVTVHVEAKDLLGNEIDVGLRIGGVLQGPIQAQIITTVDTVYTFTDATNWDIDWTAAQIAGMEIEITTVQAGMPTANTWSVDHVKAIVDYTLDAGGAAQNIALGQAAESSTAQSIVVATAFAAALGLATETDLAQSITPIQPSSVDRAVTYNPKAGWDVVEVLGAVKTSTSAFKDVVEAVPNESQAYYPTASSTSIDATGEVTTGASSFDMQWWDSSSSTWKQITYSTATGQPIVVNQSTETDTAQTITPSTTLDLAVNQSVETDTAQAITVATEVSVTLNQSSETDLAQPITVGTGLGTVVNQSAETDLAQPITPLTGNVDITLGQALETDLAQAITTTASSSVDRTVTYSPKANWSVVEVLSANLISANSVLKDIVSVPNESEIYYPITYSTSITATGIITTSSTESINLQWWSTTDSTWRQITYVIGTSFGQSTETDLAQSITVSASNSITVNQSAETDIAQPIAVGTSGAVAVGQSLESDTAQPITVATALGLTVNQSVETDTAQPITVGTGGALIAVGQSSETDLAQSIAPLVGNVGIAVGQATEIDLAQSILTPGSSSVDRSITYSPKANWNVVEVLSAPIGVVGKVGENFTGSIADESLFYYPTAYNTVITADGSISTDSTENITLQFWDKSDSTYKQVTLIIADPVGQALETDTAFSITPSITVAGTTVAVGQSTETDLAQSISVSSSVSTALNQSIETDVAQSITPLAGGVSVVVGQASESDLAQAIVTGININIAVNQASETDTAGSVSITVGNTNIPLGQATEIDIAQSLLLIGWQHSTNDTTVWTNDTDNITTWSTDSSDASSWSDSVDASTVWTDETPNTGTWNNG